MLPTTSMFIARAFGRVSQGATSTLLPKELFGLSSMRAMSSSASSSALPRSSFQTRYSVDEDLSVSRTANEVDKELAEQIAMDIVRNKYTRQLSPSGYFDPSIPIVAKHPLGWMDPARVASPTELKATTILCVRKGNKVVMMGDGQVSLGSTVVKPNARKVRRLKDNIIAGFAGATADAFTLLERLEVKLEEHPGQLLRSCVELAKSWRTDKYLRTLEAIICVADKEISLTLTGNGDVLEPNDGLIGIGSGGLYALSAAKALIGIDNLTAEDIALRSMKIASEVCVYTNSNYTVEVLDI